MARTISRGRCEGCGRSFASSGMSRHLGRCPSLAADGGRGAWHVVVESRHLSGYWLHLAIDGRAHLADLDAVLRDEWLECCGHLSEFFSGPPFGGESLDAGVRVDRVLAPGRRLSYVYDYGSSTELTIRVIGQGAPRPAGAERVRLLARNDAPEVPCACGRPAAHVCVECSWDGEGWLCAPCVSGHECGEEMLLPVVNSPRAGVCAYAG